MRNIWRTVTSSIILINILSSRCHCANNGLAITPPMGWLSWIEFACNTNCSANPKKCLNEENIRSIADRMATDGFKEAGYQYVIIDDCWLAKSRGPDGRQIPDSVRFPSGIKALADYIHKLGLKFGIYTDIGSRTCAGYPGSQNHFQLDAQTYAEWGVDYLKVDGCNADPSSYDQDYKALGRFLNLTKRPILYSCEWPAYDLAAVMPPNYAEIRATCNTWRSFLDMQTSWKGMFRVLAFWAIDLFHMSKYSGHGGWNDPDMLIVGNKALTPDQETLQMSMWSMMAAPLLMSADLREISSTSRNLLLNRHIISVSQDSLGIQGTMVKAIAMLQYWRRPLNPSPTTFAVAVVNVDPFESTSIHPCLSDFKLHLDNAEITDIFTEKTLCSHCTCVTTTIRPMSVSVMKIKLI